jgi:hypothetical protein
MNFLVGKGRSEHKADNSVVLVVPNVKVRIETQHSIPSLIIHDLLRESFSFN